MQKDETQPMCAWIAAVHNISHELADASTEVLEDDQIIILMLGLLLTYKNFVITLDATPKNQLTLTSLLHVF